MKKLVSLITVVALLTLANTVLAKKVDKQVEGELPAIAGFIFEMPDGTEVEFMLPSENGDEVTTKSLILPPVIILPPITIWQAGWFWYDGVAFFGWRGPNGIFWIMSIDHTGTLHTWYWAGFWLYSGTM